MRTIAFACLVLPAVLLGGSRQSLAGPRLAGPRELSSQQLDAVSAGLAVAQGSASAFALGALFAETITNVFVITNSLGGLNYARGYSYSYSISQ